MAFAFNLFEAFISNVAEEALAGGYCTLGIRATHQASCFAKGFVVPFNSKGAAAVNNKIYVQLIKTRLANQTL